VEACVRDEYEPFAERIAQALAPPEGTRTSPPKRARG
jgi:hypothetical protein